MSRHKTVVVEYKDKKANIDVKIAPLIKEMWKAGIDTSMSCQNSDGKVWIEFEDIEHMCDFLNIISLMDSAGEGLRHKIDISSGDSGWDFDLHIADLHGPDLLDYLLQRAGDDDDYKDWLLLPCFMLHCAVFFPRSDLPLVFERMKRHNKK